MPSLETLHLARSPRSHPLTYPGVAADFDYLWMDTWVYRMRTPGTARGTVVIDGGPLSVGSAKPCGLGDVLHLADATPMDGRYPILAFGSNAAPAQLHQKFARLSLPSRVVPVTRGTVRGLSISHSAHVSSPGYIPYVVIDDASSAVDVFVLWLDPHQLAVLDATEPNYDLVEMHGYPLVLATGETVPTFSLYRGRWDALRLPGESAAVPGGTQSEIYGTLGLLGWFPTLLGSVDVPTQVERLRRSSTLRSAVREQFRAEGMVIGDGIRAATGRRP